MAKQIKTDDFPPSKPDKDGVRYLRGKKALEFKKAWEETNIILRINPVFYIILEARRLLIEYMNFEARYFDDRHLYTPEERRLLDLMFINRFEYTKLSDPGSTMIFSQRIIYRYLKHKYSPEDKRVCYWLRTTSHSDKKPIYVWHEDVEKYDKLGRKPPKARLVV